MAGPVTPVVHLARLLRLQGERNGRRSTTEKGKRRRRGGRDWTRNDPQVFLSAPIEAVRSFVVGNTNSKWRRIAASGRRTMGWRLSFSPHLTLGDAIDGAALFQRSRAVAWSRSTSEIMTQIRSILSRNYVGNKNSDFITVGTNKILPFFFPLRGLPIPSMASVLGNLSYYTYKYDQSDSRHTNAHVGWGIVRWL